MASPFDSVPIEVLSMILKWAVTTDVYNPESFFVTHPTDLNVVASLLLVCKTWKRVIFSEGEIWAAAIDVDDFNLEENKSFVSLAKNTPLVIVSDRDNADSLYDERLFETPNWEYVFKLIERWGVFSLEWESIDSENMRPLVDALSHPAPNLDLFQINNMVYFPGLAENEVAHLNDKFFVLPDNLFAGQSPRLTKFAITDAYVRSTFDFSVWTHITDLDVNLSLGGLLGDKISSRKWLEVLRQMKQLQLFSLSWIYDVEFDNVVHLLPIDSERNGGLENVADVHLDHLKKLELLAACEWNIMLDIFPKLIVPDACITSVTLLRIPERKLPFDWLTIGLGRRVTGWKAAATPLYICVENPMSDIPFDFGFHIYFGAESADAENYNFSFNHAVCSRPSQVPKDPYANFPEMLRVLKLFTPSSWVSVPECVDRSTFSWKAS